MVILGGIYSGYFAVSEAAALTAFYVLVVSVVIRREISLRSLPVVMRDSMKLVGAILLILGVSLASTNYMIDAGIPEQILILFSSTSAALLLSCCCLRCFAGAGHDAGYLFGHRHYDSDYSAHCGAVRYSSDSFGDFVLSEHAAGVFHSACGDESLYCQLPLQQTRDAAVLSDHSVFVILLACVLVITFWPWLSLGML